MPVQESAAAAISSDWKLEAIVARFWVYNTPPQKRTLCQSPSPTTSRRSSVAGGLLSTSGPITTGNAARRDKAQTWSPTNDPLPAAACKPPPNPQEVPAARGDFQSRSHQQAAKGQQLDGADDAAAKVSAATNYPNEERLPEDVLQEIRKVRLAQGIGCY